MCVLPPTNQQTWLATNQVVAKSIEFKILLFETKFVRAFSRPQSKLVSLRNARVRRNSRVILSNRKSVSTVHNLQKHDFLQDRLESWVVNCTTSLKFRSFRNNVGKQLTRCCCPFTVARPSATPSSSHLVHCVVSCGNRNLTDLHLRQRTAGKFKRAAGHVSSPSWRPKSMFSGEELLIPDPGSSATILYFSKTQIEALRAPYWDSVERRCTQRSYVRGGSAPRPNPLTFYVPLLTGKVPLSCYTGTLFMHLVKTLHPF